MVKIKKISIILVTLIILFSTTIAYAGTAENITSTIGSSWINFTWDYNSSSNCSVWIDGEYAVNTSLNYYILSGLDARETHTISLINTTNSSEIYGTSSTKTFYPPVLFYIIIILSCVFLFAEFLMKNEIITVILGVLCFIISTLGFYISFPYYFAIFSYLLLAFAIISFLWCIVAALSLMTKETGDIEDV